MTASPLATSLMAHVSRRLRLAALSRRWFAVTMAGCAAYAVALLVIRFSGTVNYPLRPWTLLGIPLAALAVSFFWHRRPNRLDAARAVDQHAANKDLYLTWTMLEDAAGSYHPLVIQRAEEEAAAVRPEQVVPWHPGRRVAWTAAAFGTLLLGVLFLPQYDPFGQIADAQERKQLQVEAKKDRQANQLRLAQLERDNPAEKEKEQVTQTIEELTSTFGKMQKQAKEVNLQQLNLQQKEIGSQWKSLATEKLKTLLNQANAFQDFGGRRQAKLDKWTKELQDGASTALQQEMNELADLAKEMQQTSDPVKKAELAQEMKQRLKDLERFATENAGSPELAAAIRRAMRQVEAGEAEGMKAETAEAMAEAMQLARVELDQLAQSAENLKSLEDALRTMQMAKQLNESGMLEGNNECTSLADYADYYARLMKEAGTDGDGEGTGGRGQGRGGQVPEDESVTTGEKLEKSPAAVTAGKILLSMKGKGVSDSGEAQKDYQELVHEVQQGVSQAILQEQIPPGYHDGIRRYFDSIDKAQP